MTISTKVFVLLPILCGAGMATQAQNLYVRKHDGTQTTNSIAEIRSIKFAPNNVYVHKNTGIDNYALDAIRYMNFTDLMVGINEKNKPNNLSFSLFPNPANNQLNITFPKNLEENGTITMYTIDGKIVFKQLIHRANSTFQFNIGSLNTGIYFCTINVGTQSNTQKFIKH